MYRQGWKNRNGTSQDDSSSNNDMMYPSSTSSSYPQHYQNHPSSNGISSTINGEDDKSSPRHLPQRRIFYVQPTSLRERLFSKIGLGLGILFLLIVISSRWISNFIIVRTISTSSTSSSKADLLAKQLKYMYDKQQRQQQSSSQQPLLVHLIHTTDESSFKKHNALAIESIFYHHPNAHVILHVPPKNSKSSQQVEIEAVASDGGGVISAVDSDKQDQVQKGNGEVELMMSHTPIRPFIDAGYNITLRQLDIEVLLQQVIDIQDSITSKVDTTKVSEFQKRISQYEIYATNWYVDVSDLARLLLLYVYGGVYLDTDVIVVKPLVANGDSEGNDATPPPLPNNVLAWEQQDDDYDKSLSKGKANENHKLANGAIMKFLYPHNAFLADCINEYMSTYQITNKWGYNGPQLLTRVFSNNKYSKCQLEDQYNNHYDDNNDKDESCPIIMLPKVTFYPLSWWRINEICFQNPQQFHIYKPMIDHMSYVVHINNKISSTMWERYNGKLVSGTVCSWLYTSYCVLCDKNGNNNGNSGTAANNNNGFVLTG